MKNIIAYLQGNIRYKLWYSKLRWIIPNHIQEQITMRIDYMKLDCYCNGVCTECGCITTALQMANKPCDGACYPEMMNSRDWHKFIMDGTYLTNIGYTDSKGIHWIYRKDCLTRYCAKTFQKDILLPINKKVCG